MIISKKIFFTVLSFTIILFCSLLIWQKDQINNLPSAVINSRIKEKETSVFDPSFLIWQEATFDALWQKRDAHTALVFSDKIWLLGGVSGNAPDYSKNKSDVWSSEDGKDWILVSENAPWGPRRAHESLVFNNQILILGGVTTGEVYLNDVWSSPDGENWLQIQKKSAWTKRKGFEAVVFKDKIWIMGGVDTSGAVNDVWFSEDGINWQLATDRAKWPPRYDLAVEVFGGKMWLSGGVLPGEMGQKEVWFTEDGTNWELAEDIPWRGRHGHCFISYNDYLWIIGGWSGFAEGFNDVWFSKDGLLWHKTLADSLWPGREDSACLVFQNKIWFLGGMLTSGLRTNDVWFSI
ncbi:MAG: galactose oxidase [Parcubacteria group bacterium]